MFDKVTFIYSLPTPVFGSEEDLALFGIGFRRQYSKKTQQYYYEGYHRNLRFAIYETRLYVSNSLSGYLYGHNANDITYGELCMVIDEICTILSCSRQELIVKDYEFGFTLPTTVRVQKIIERLISHWNTLAKNEFRKGKLTSAKFYHEDYAFKAYDKSLVEMLEGRMGMKGNWLRIEQQAQKKYFKKFIRNADDLTNPENIQKVFDLFLKNWRLIRKMPFIDHSKFSKGEIERIYALLNPLYIEDCKDYKSKEALKKERQRLTKKLEAEADYSLFHDIEKAFTEKFRRLMANENVPNFLPLLLEGNWGQNRFIIPQIAE